MFRIPHGRNETESAHLAKPKPVVFLQHALLDSAFEYVANSEEDSLAFLLADAGYDVWLGNNRGNTFSSHRRSTKTVNGSMDAGAWNWTWDELAHEDIPAMLRKVLEVTGVPDLVYVGHSQGTLQGFVRFSEDEELASKIRLMVALAPVACVGHTEGLFGKGWVQSATSTCIRSVLPGKGFLSKDWGLNSLGAKLASWGMDCGALVRMVCGDNADWDKDRMAVYLAHTPAGTSSRNMLHWFSMLRAHAAAGNDPVLKMYIDSDTPSSAQKRARRAGLGLKEVSADGDHDDEYDLSKLEFTMRNKIIAYSGGKDHLATPKDTQILMSKLGAAIKKHVVIDHYSHLDFSWGITAKDNVYRDVLAEIATAFLYPTLSYALPSRPVNARNLFGSRRHHTVPEFPKRRDMAPKRKPTVSPRLRHNLKRHGH